MVNNQAIGFIGLGIMGKAMARNLVKAGVNLFVYDLVLESIEQLAAMGATACSSGKEVAEQSDIVITIVPDTPHVQAALFGPNGIAEGVKPGSIFVDMSSISPIDTRVFAKKLRDMQVEMLDAPVSGAEVGAQQGNLTIFVGGKKEVFDKVRPVFDVLGSRCTLMGDVGAGQTAKSCNMVINSITQLGICEALTLAAANGLDLDNLISALSAGTAQSRQLENLGPRITRGDMDPGFMVDLMQKDLSNVLESARRLKVPAFGTTLVNQLFQTLQVEGNGRLGVQSLVLVYEKLANRKVKSEQN